MQSYVNRFLGLKDLAYILIKEDRVKDACEVLKDCQGKAPPMDNGAVVFLIHLMQNCTASQSRKIGWLMDEFCPERSSLSMKSLIRNRIMMHARLGQSEEINKVLEALPRMERVGLFKPPFRPLLRAAEEWQPPSHEESQ